MACCNFLFVVNYHGATQILENIEKQHPDVLIVPLRRISLERRFHHHRKAEELFQSYLGNAKNPEIEVFFAVRFARFYLKVSPLHSYVIKFQFACKRGIEFSYICSRERIAKVLHCS